MALCYNIRYETISATSTLDSTMLSLLSATAENIIIPTSGDINTLRRVIDELREMTMSAIEKQAYGSYMDGAR